MALNIAKEYGEYFRGTQDLVLGVELNAFDYEQSIQDAKIRAVKDSKKEQATIQRASFKQKLLSKDSRIKEASQRICPYKGEQISEGKGEIDHIIPRAYSLKTYGTIFNNEANLIYASSKGNKAKGKDSYTLEDLNAKYVQKVFGDKDPKKFIEKTLKDFNPKHFKAFHLLSTDEQIALRHVLFMPSSEVYDKAIECLKRGQTSLVNGTQKYLVKHLIAYLKRYDIAVQAVHLVDYVEVRRLRDNLASGEKPEDKKFYQKPKGEKQPPISHIIDASLVYTALAGEVFDGEHLKEPEGGKLLASKTIKHYIEDYHLDKALTQAQFLKKISTKPIFKDGLYNLEYKPIIKYEDGDGIKFYRAFTDFAKGFEKHFNAKKNTAKELELYSTIIAQEKYCRKTRTNGNYTLYVINKPQVDEAAHNCFSVENYPDKDFLAQMALITNSKKWFKRSEIKAPITKPKDELKKDHPALYAQHLALYELWTTTKAKMPQATDEEVLKVVCEAFFGKTSTKRGDHKGKKYSIKTPSNPPGTALRLRRRTPKGYIYQALPINKDQVGDDKYAAVLVLSNPKGNLSLISDVPKPQISKSHPPLQNTKLRLDEVLTLDFINAHQDILTNAVLMATGAKVEALGITECFDDFQERFAILEEALQKIKEDKGLTKNQKQKQQEKLKKNLFEPLIKPQVVLKDYGVCNYDKAKDAFVINFKKLDQQIGERRSKDEEKDLDRGTQPLEQD